MPDSQAGKSFSDYLCNISMSNSFFLSPVSSEQIEDIISSLMYKSSNLLTYPTILIKSIKSLWSPLLSNIINLSFTCGFFPKFLKIAHVIPIYKSGEKTKPGNYRPISIISFLSKVFEKAVSDKLYSFFEHFQLFDFSQFGFREKFSTLNVISNMLQFIYSHLDAGKIFYRFFLISVKHSIAWVTPYFFINERCMVFEGLLY